MLITSKQNTQIKQARALLDAKGRHESGLFLAEGLRAVIQAMRSGAKIEKLIYAPELLISQLGKETVSAAQLKGIECLEVSHDVLMSLARKEKPQGILAVLTQEMHKLEHIEKSPSGLWLGVEAIQNPGNLGTILRIADAVGAKGLIVLGESTDHYDPAAVKASMGSVFTVPVFRPTLASLSAFLTKNPELRVVGTSDKGSQDFAAYPYPKDCLIFLGSERQGLSDDLMDLCDDVVSIPMQGACDSLNIAVAAGIIAYQAYLQNRMTNDSQP